MGFFSPTQKAAGVFAAFFYYSNSRSLLLVCGRGCATTKHFEKKGPIFINGLRYLTNVLSGSSVAAAPLFFAVMTNSSGSHNCSASIIFIIFQ